MIYFDTSFIAPLFFSENTSDEVGCVIQALSTQELAVSYWTKAEFTSLTARRFRMKELTKADSEKILDEFEEYISTSFETLIPMASDFSLAITFIKKYETKLRAGDALHLAIAKNRNVNAFYTLDKQLVSASKLLGIPVSI